MLGSREPEILCCLCRGNDIYNSRYVTAMTNRIESLCCRMVGVGIGAESMASCGLAAKHSAGMATGSAGVSSAGLSGLWGVSDSFLKRPSYETFRKVLAMLREDLPPAHPVVIRTKVFRESFPAMTFGECVRRPERFVIRLNTKMDQNMAIETLLHEWAHALAWNYSLDRLARDPDVTQEKFEAASHDEAWGCAYSRVWRAYTTFGSNLD